MARTPLVSIICINFKVSQDIFVLLKTLENIDYPLNSIELIIVNNLLDSGSEKKLEKILSGWKTHCARVVSIRNSSNVGLSYALNQALAKVSKQSDYIWRIDNDLKLDKHALSALIDVIDADPTIGLVGSKAFAYDDPTLFVDGGWHLNWFLGYSRTFDSDEPSECDYISGRSELVRTSTAKKIGYLGDLSLFAYFEDMDFCIQVQKLGKKVVYVPDSIVYHKYSSEGEYLPYKVRLMTRNRILFMRKNATTLQRIVFFTIFSTLGLAGFLAFLVRKRASLSSVVTSTQIFLSSFWEGLRADLHTYFIP